MSNPNESHNAAVDAGREAAEAHAKAEVKRNAEANAKVYPDARTGERRPLPKA